jgi:L-ascorbate metabolism protein UlaG (beta-lactamase superfamily)
MRWLALLLLFIGTPAWASCLSIAQRSGIVLASVPKDHVQLTFVGHATFLIESPAGVRIATDYNDYVRPSVTPDIATMNIAHSTHHTMSPDPAIRHVLRGWETDGGTSRHDLAYKDVRVRNVPTNIRDWSGGGTRMNANSIFIFEISGLCVAHLGHLHHSLTPARLGEIGEIDVLLVPVDGSYTLNDVDLVETLKQIRARLMIPMHFFSQHGLEAFLSQVEKQYPIRRQQSATVVVSKDTLPRQPEVLVLPGR